MKPIQLFNPPASCFQWSEIQWVSFFQLIEPRITSTHGHFPIELFSTADLLRRQEEEILSLPDGKEILSAIPASFDPLFYYRRERWLDDYNREKFLSCIPEGRSFQEIRELAIVDKGITRLPAEIGLCSGVETLVIMNNPLRELPAAFGQLVNLRTLVLNGNRLAGLCPEFSQLHKLEKLELNRNALQDINPIGYLQNLKHLSATFNQIGRLPSQVHWAQLEYLLLDHNRITELPEQFYQLESLECASFNNNQIRDITCKNCRLSNLKSLFLDANKLTALPLGMNLLPRLQSLSVKQNELLELPNSLNEMPSLEEICLVGNKINQRPPFLKSKIWTDV